MGEPAIVLEEAAEQASSQTTRLILIEGGKNVAAAEGVAATGEGIAWASVGATALAVAAFFAVLLYPSSLGPEPQVDRPTPEPVPPKAPSVDLETGCDEGQDPQDECKKIRVDILTQYEKLGKRTTKVRSCS